MRFILSSLVALAIVAASYFLFINGSPRAEVAKKMVMARLDDILGKLDVQKAEIDAGIRATRQGIEGVRKAKIKAQVSLEILDDKAKPFEDKITQCDQTLARLRDLLNTDMAAEIAGRTYSVADLKAMANKVLQVRKDADATIIGFKSAHDNLQKVVVNLAKTQQNLETRLTSFQGQIAKIDAEMAAAKAMKQASASIGDKSQTLAANLDDLEQKIAALSAEVRTELKAESERWSDSNQAISDVDAFIRDAQQPTDTLAEIDRILGPAKK